MAQTPRHFQMGEGFLEKFAVGIAEVDLGWGLLWKRPAFVETGGRFHFNHALRR
ncbi:MAG: hypothetical protein GY805_27470, partial [Chloroflexi bacterium]|nr:hypothetical protein [Chloroflexota bacterium]